MGKWLTIVFFLGPSLASAQDTLVVTADQPPAWGTATELVEELRLGALEGPSELTFGRVTAATPIEDELWIVDDRPPRIRRFGPDGRYRGDVGREGAGPGEFRQVLGLQPHPEGAAVWDPGNGRITVFSATGELVRSLSHASGFYTADAFQVDTAGHFYVKSMTPGGGASQGRPPQTRWTRLSPTGEVEDSLPIPSSPGSGSGVLQTSAGPRWPFTHQVSSFLSPLGYLVEGTNTEYAIFRPVEGGGVIRIERPYDRVRVRPEERREWEQRLERAGRRGGGLSQARVPGGAKPPFREIRVDLEGRIWVSRYTRAVHHPQSTPEESGRPRYEWREPPVWDVLDPRGQFLGTLTTSEGRLAAARGGRVWIVEEGEYGEQYVVRYRIEPGS